VAPQFTQALTVGLLPRLANAIACHALVNVLSGALFRASTFLSYGLFPFLLWMFWRMEGLLQKVQAAYCINLWFYTHLSILANGFSTVSLILGGNLFWAFLLASLIPLSPSQVFYANFGCFSWSLPAECDSGLIAWNLPIFARQA